MEHGSAKIGEIFNFGMLHLEWPTALFVLVVFFVTMTFLNTWLFKPILRTLEARQSKMDDNEEKTKELSSTIEKTEQDYQGKLASVREKIQETRQNALDEAITKAREVIGQTNETISKQMEESEKELAKERDSALKDAVSLTENLSQLIKNKVLA